MGRDLFATQPEAQPVAKGRDLFAVQPEQVQPEIQAQPAQQAIQTAATVPPEATVGEEIVGGLDTAKTIISSAVAQPVAGIIGGLETGGRADLRFLGFDAVETTGECVKTINAIKNFISLDPSTEEGHR